MIYKITCYYGSNKNYIEPKNFPEARKQITKEEVKRIIDAINYEGIDDFEFEFISS